MNLYKIGILFFLFFICTVYYKKLKKSFFIIFILLRRIKFVNHKKISNTDNEGNIEISDKNNNTFHDYSSEEEMPPSPELSSKNFKKD